MLGCDIIMFTLAACRTGRQYGWVRQGAVPLVPLELMTTFLQA